MKKALVIVLTLVLALSVVGLVSCAGKTYQGEYSYVSWGNTYGCKVKVTVQGNVITKVVILEEEMEEAGWHNLSPNWTNNPYAGPIEGEAGYDTAGKTNWLKYGQAMVDSFVGLTTEQVLGMKVYVNATGNVGEPITGKNNVETIKYIPEQLAVVVGGHGEIAKDAGATQSSARLVLAVQNALLGGKENPNCVSVDMGVTKTGECKYENAWKKGAYYGAKVDVTVKNGKITAVKLYTDEETGWTRTTSSWTEKTQADVDADETGKTVLQLGYAKAEAAYEQWIKDTFVGKTPAEVLAYEATATQSAQTVTTAEAKLVGATQSSARIICAVQDALAKF